MNQEKANVLIIGSGVAGLTTALFLNKAGIKCEVFEGSPSEKETGAGFVLAPNGVNVLDSLGLTTELNKYSYPIGKESTYNTDNEEIMSIVASGNKLFNNQLVTIQRHKLIKILLDKANAVGIPVHYNKKLVDLNQEHRGVKAFFADGSSEQGALLVGADGIHSKTREITYPTIKPIYSGFYGIHGISSSSLINMEMDTEAKTYIDFDNYIGVFISKSSSSPTNDLLWQFIGKSERKIPATSLELADRSYIKDWLLKQTKDWNNPFREILRNTEVILPRSIYELENMNHWYHGRVVFVGDALHATNPLPGIGASWALEDGMYLAKMLKEHGYRDAFHYYENDRKPMVELFKNASDNGLNELLESIETMRTVYGNQIDW
ncbi:2-polyprenyl-6-methoxyphenol hydroxylase-like FAD-dependent oxidoreductase [Geomicrobium halophilum]|uniref:2-polyprenyl-6-methoxyphenol hydroxylase-like FAD-dependent oxidoreductase n=1 Tax=Geomicrobium halophilum TaxID=549000 RepID=A0A841PTI3_9BACL|nr:FAD-dependent monooxygenase [Geomicrobium halophilum]MBB6451084.1 2-polyprenyl-6-methoxyphenol hydroxylase-like FAD-dependent oxidoreductase [Geomicrobium halophilum]